MNCRLLCTFAALTLTLPTFSQGQAFVDPGFESYAVGSGGFLKPASGPWVFGNDAGVVEPFAPSSSTGPLNTWSATFLALEGQQYVSTYAAGDTVRQALSFASPGAYKLSVYAAAPSGTVTIPTVATLTLVDGEFTFTLNNAAFGSLNTVALGSNWALYSAVVTIGAPGTYDLGVRNTKGAPYFINYDAFAIEPVPEPAAGRLLLALAVMVVLGFSTRQPWFHSSAHASDR